MELYLIRRAEYDRLYNCTLYNVDSVPLESRQRVVVGSTMLALVSIYVASLSSFGVIVLKEIERVTFNPSLLRLLLFNPNERNNDISKKQRKLGEKKEETSKLLPDAPVCLQRFK